MSKLRGFSVKVMFFPYLGEYLQSVVFFVLRGILVKGLVFLYLGEFSSRVFFLYLGEFP